jgi:putative restriction endonuclease
LEQRAARGLRGVRGEHWADVEPEERALRFSGIVTGSAQHAHGPARGARLRLGVVDATVRARAADAMHLLGCIDQQEEEGECARGDGDVLDGERFYLGEQLVEGWRFGGAMSSRSACASEGLYRIECGLALEAAYDSAEGRGEPAHVVVQGDVLAPDARASDRAQIGIRGRGAHACERKVYSAGVAKSSCDAGFEAEDVRQPDVFVVPRNEWRRVIREGYPARELLLAVEVLSPSNARDDRVRKRPGYQRHVSEYWIVDLEARLIERWRPGDDRPEILTERLTWHPSGARVAMTVELPPFFARVFGDDVHP